MINVLAHNYARIKIDSYGSLPLEKILTLHNVIKQNHYNYNVFLEIYSYQLA